MKLVFLIIFGEGFTLLHKLVDRISDESVLGAYLVLLQREVERENQNDFWLELDDKTKQAIEEGLRDVEDGRTVDAISFMKSTYGV